MLVMHEPSLDMTPAHVSCTNCRHQFPETALFCPNCGTAKVRDQASDALRDFLRSAAAESAK